MIKTKAQILRIMSQCDGADSLTREEKFQVFCKVCDNALAAGNISKVNHRRWTNIY